MIMKKHEYIAKRPFAAFEPGNRVIERGEKVSIRNKSVANDMIEKGLLYPKYDTKEDKRAYKVETKARIEHDAGPMFYVIQGDEVIDRLKKSEAEQLRDKINGVSA